MHNAANIDTHVETIIRLGLRDVVGNSAEIAAAIDTVLNKEGADADARFVAIAAREYLSASLRTAETGSYTTYNYDANGRLQSEWPSPGTESTLFSGACDAYYRSIGLDYNESAERIYRHRRNMA